MLVDCVAGNENHKADNKIFRYLIFVQTFDLSVHTFTLELLQILHQTRTWFSKEQPRLRKKKENSIH